MSYTTIKAIWPGEKHEDIRELRNSYGSAPYVWNELCKRYFGTKDHSYLLGGVLDRLWPIWKDVNIPEHHRAVLMMTYDHAYVAKKDYRRAANDILKFLEDFPPKSGEVNHWGTILDFFDCEPTCPAIGFHMTSVSDDPFEGPWNEEKEEYDQPDWSKIYDLYADLDSLKGGK